MKPEEAFGKTMRSLRTQKGYSQEQLAHSCGLDRTFISMLERGQRQPSLTSILVIASSLKIPANELVRLTVELLSKE